MEVVCMLSATIRRCHNVIPMTLQRQVILTIDGGWMLLCRKKRSTLMTGACWIVNTQERLRLTNVSKGLDLLFVY
jgi:hypothetical protein